MIDEHSRTIVLRTLIYLDRAGTNLSIKDLKEKVFYDLDYFEENIHRLLLEGEISDIDYKIYPVGSKNLTNKLFEEIKTNLNDLKLNHNNNSGGLAS